MSKVEIPQEAKEVIEKLVQTGLVEKYATENQFVPMDVAEMVLTQDEMSQLDRIGRCSSEEWSEITNIKLRQQPQVTQVIVETIKRLIDSRKQQIHW